MIKEIFKNQVCITELAENKIEYVIRLAAAQDSIQKGALSTVLQSNKNYLFKPTDKLFFLGGCTVPRFKVKQLCEVTGMTTVKAIENSTVTIYGDDTERSITREDFSYYNIDKDKMLTFIEQNYKLGDPNVIKIKDILADPETFDIVNLDGYSMQSILTGSETWVLHPVSKNRPTFHKSVWVTEEKKIADFDKMLEDGRTVVHQNDLLSIININNVMDREMYEQACKMFESEDESNHVLAIEIMANCDYEKSALYLYLLIKDFRHKIYDRPESKHVNYQALCKFFNIKRDHRLHDLEDLIKELSQRNFINSSHREELLRLSTEEGTERLSNKYYTIAQISPNEEMEKIFKRGDLRVAGLPIPKELLAKGDDDDDEEDVEEELTEEIENDND